MVSQKFKAANLEEQLRKINLKFLRLVFSSVTCRSVLQLPARYCSLSESKFSTSVLHPRAKVCSRKCTGLLVP